MIILLFVNIYLAFGRTVLKGIFHAAALLIEVGFSELAICMNLSVGLSWIV